jgi:hypothetical protein
MRQLSATWYVEEKGTCFVVRDHGGQALTRVYFSGDEAWPPICPLKFTRDEARLIATSVFSAPPCVILRI